MTSSNAEGSTVEEKGEGALVASLFCFFLMWRGVVNKVLLEGLVGCVVSWVRIYG